MLTAHFDNTVLVPSFELPSTKAWRLPAVVAVDARCALGREGQRRGVRGVLQLPPLPQQAADVDGDRQEAEDHSHGEQDPDDCADRTAFIALSHPPHLIWEWALGLAP